MLNGEVTTEVGPDVLDDLLPPFSTLARRTSSMVDHVLGDQLIDRRIVAFRPATKQLFNHVLRLGRHRRNGTPCAGGTSLPGAARSYRSTWRSSASQQCGSGVRMGAWVTELQLDVDGEQVGAQHADVERVERAQWVPGDDLALTGQRVVMGQHGGDA